MRALCVVLAVMLLAQSAEARGGRRNDGDDASQSDAARKKAKAEAEKAYQDALKRIPDQNVKVDPWGKMR